LVIVPTGHFSTSPSARDAAFLDHGVKGDQQVEVRGVILAWASRYHAG
jgi:hypothetical protein